MMPGSQGRADRAASFLERGAMRGMKEMEHLMLQCVGDLFGKQLVVLAADADQPLLKTA